MINLPNAHINTAPRVGCCWFTSLCGLGDIAVFPLFSVFSLPSNTVYRKSRKVEKRRFDVSSLFSRWSASNCCCGTSAAHTADHFEKDIIVPVRGSFRHQNAKKIAPLFTKERGIYYYFADGSVIIFRCCNHQVVVIV